MDDHLEEIGHAVTADGQERCHAEYVGERVDHPTGPMVEIRCPHYFDVLRYEPAP